MRLVIVGTVDGGALARELAALNLVGISQQHNAGEAIVLFSDDGDGSENFFTFEADFYAEDDSGHMAQVMEPIFAITNGELVEDGQGGYVRTGQKPAKLRERRVKPEIIAAVTEVIDAHISPEGQLNRYKLTKRSEFNAERERRSAQPAVWDVYQVDADPVSIQKVNGAVTMALIAKGAGAPFQVGWTMADNQNVVLDADQTIEMGMAVGTHVAAQHEWARDKKDLIDQAQTKEEVDLVTF